jgi:hypothetical protein
MHAYIKPSLVLVMMCVPQETESAVQTEISETFANFMYS